MSKSPVSLINAIAGILLAIALILQIHRVNQVEMRLTQTRRQLDTLERLIFRLLKSDQPPDGAFLPPDDAPIGE